MKRVFIPLSIALWLLNFALPLHAQSVKTITLKDGSVIKGEVTQLTDGVYTLTTSNLGAIHVPESEVVSIASEEPTENAQVQPLKSQVQEIQSNLLSDPEIIAEIQKIIQDEEIRGVLSDPAFMNAIFSYDPNKIQQNEKTQYLLQNPKFQSLMEKIRTKLPEKK